MHLDNLDPRVFRVYKDPRALLDQPEPQGLRELQARPAQGRLACLALLGLQDLKVIKEPPDLSEELERPGQQAQPELDLLVLLVSQVVQVLQGIPETQDLRALQDLGVELVLQGELVRLDQQDLQVRVEQEVQDPRVHLVQPDLLELQVLLGPLALVEHLDYLDPLVNQQELKVSAQQRTSV